MGGIYGGGLSPITTNVFQEFDPSTNTWTAPATSGTFTPRGYVSSAVVGNSLYVIGGVDTSGGNTYVVPTNEFFTPSVSDVKNSVTALPDIQLVPNPTNGLITVYNTNPVKQVIIENLFGETIKDLRSLHESNFTLDLSTLPSGTYFARFSLPGSVITRKIIRD